MRPLFDLQGQVALVTGAAGGLGFAMAEALAQHGAQVMLSDLDPVRCEAAAAQLRGRGLAASAHAFDVADQAQCESAVDAVLARFGRLDTLVSNAGIEGPVGPMRTGTPRDWERVLGINLLASVWLTSRAIPAMAEAGGGSVILVASIAGLRGTRAIGPYGVSKAGLVQLARSLAVEWGPRNVRVNAICPGLIETPFAAQLLADQEFMARRLAATPLRRPGQPEEVAGLAVMLAARAGGFITGQALVVDGGTLVSDGG
ncbi:SDR family oxidoreductase [Ramlibacter sp. XY19]|uniref:SDR family NAD(P)-dependent oxidoreductase n=1 Tax=Ramlibacter paludis TaxID=2908000 RepID=UPI0023DB63B9|nr:SDR family NAD(P)-dependent oxidoreductase [Ramlibacter paludis]MCG2592411.1 SDR family oxidoreductase [Ramlibacter paludis]